MDIEVGGKDRSFDRKTAPGAALPSESLQGEQAVLRTGGVDLPTPGGTGQAFIAAIPGPLKESLNSGDRVIRLQDGTFEKLDEQGWATNRVPELPYDPQRHLYRAIIQADWGSEPSRYQFPPEARGEWWEAARKYVVDSDRRSPFGQVVASVSKDPDCTAVVSKANAEGFLAVAETLPGWMKDGVPAISVDLGVLPEAAKSQLSDWRGLVLLGADSGGYAVASQDGELEYVDTSRAKTAAFHAIDVEAVAGALQALGYGAGFYPTRNPYDSRVLETGKGRITFDLDAGMATYRGRNGVEHDIDLVSSPWSDLLVVSGHWNSYGAAIIASELMATAGEADPLSFEEAEADGFRLSWVHLGSQFESYGEKTLYAFTVQAEAGWSFTSCGKSGAIHHGEDADDEVRRLVADHLSALDRTMLAEHALCTMELDGTAAYEPVYGSPCGGELNERARQLSEGLALAMRDQWGIQEEEE